MEWLHVHRSLGSLATVDRITGDFCRCNSELYIHTGSSNGGTYVDFGGPHAPDIKLVAITVLIPNVVQARWCFSLVRQHKSVAKPMYSLIPPCTYWFLLEVVILSRFRLHKQCCGVTCSIYVTCLSPMDSGAS